MGNWTSIEENRFPLTRRTAKKYGWVPDLPDQRDIMGSFPKDIKVRKAVDLRSSGFMPKIYNQGQLGSCTANALVGAFEFDQKKQELEDFLPSRQFVYYNERLVEGTEGVDAGASIRDGIKVLNRLGVCPEEDCVYDVDFFTNRPTEQAYTNANNHKAVQYRKLPVSVDSLTKSLTCGIPVVFGFSVYESFESESMERTGIMPIPKSGEKILGGHAVLAVGYDMKREFILVRNSWGTEWGQKGYFWMSFKFFNSRNVSDVWIIQRVRNSKQTIKLSAEPVKTEVEEVEEVGFEKEEILDFKEDKEEEDKEEEDDLGSV